MDAGDFDSPKQHKIEQDWITGLIVKGHKPGRWQSSGPDRRRLACVAPGCHLEVRLMRTRSPGNDHWGIVVGHGTASPCPYLPEFKLR